MYRAAYIDRISRTRPASPGCARLWVLVPKSMGSSQRRAGRRGLRSQAAEEAQCGKSRKAASAASIFSRGTSRWVHQAGARTQRRQNAAQREMRPEGRNVPLRNVDIEDVGLRRVGFQTQRPQPGREMLRIGMILGKPPHMMLQGVEARRREHPRLPHSASQCLAPSPRLRDEFRGPQQHRSGRGAQTLRQADRHRIEAVDGDPLVDLKLHDGVENSRAVQMGGKTLRVRELGGLPQIGRRQYPPADGIFKCQEPSAREMDVLGFDRLGDSVDRYPPIRIVLQGLRLMLPSTAAPPCSYL